MRAAVSGTLPGPTSVTHSGAPPYGGDCAGPRPLWVRRRACAGYWLSIQFRYLATLVKTDGEVVAVPQLTSPQEAMPTTCPLTVSGPPASPWQMLAAPPSTEPAHSMPSLTTGARPSGRLLSPPPRPRSRLAPEW